LRGVLIAPIVTQQVSVMTNLILAATAAALVAGVPLLPDRASRASSIGIAQTELNRYVQPAGLRRLACRSSSSSWPGDAARRLPLRDYFLQRLPSIGSAASLGGGVVPASAVGSCSSDPADDLDRRITVTSRRSISCSRSSSSPATRASSRCASSRSRLRRLGRGRAGRLPGAVLARAA
jgi:hypothetical protein